MYFALGKITGSRSIDIQHFILFWEFPWIKLKSLRKKAKLAFKSASPKAKLIEKHGSMKTLANLTEVSAQNSIQTDFEVDIASFSLDGSYLRCSIVQLWRLLFLIM